MVNPPLESLQRSPRLSSWNKGDVLLREGKGCKGESRIGMGRQGRRGVKRE